MPLPRAPPSLTDLASPTMATTPPRPLPNDLIPGILVRLPPDDPAGIVRASAVCKAWRRILADPAFAGSYRALHPAAPVLGFLHNQNMLNVARFRHEHDCRHGRAIFLDYGSLSSFVVWDPIACNVQHKIPEVPDVLTHPAVVCAAGGACDHRGCSGGPFIVAFVGVQNIPEDDYFDAHACFYSSDTGEWSIHINIRLDHGRYQLEDHAAALVGDALYFVGRSGFLLRYRYGLLRQVGHKDIISAGIREADVLSVIEPPQGKRLRNVIVMTAEDGGLGLASLCRDRLITLWSRETTGPIGDAGQWVQRRVIDLKTLLPVGNPKRRPCLRGVAEDGDLIFVSSEDGVFTVELKSSQVKKVCDMGKVDLILPFVSFYTDSLLMLLSDVARTVRWETSPSDIRVLAAP
ncbi:hypothetical protein C2845_PM07G08390 [Panicum miliaceum]|uniref:F-box domain-containing protein n=1 Tax=Panicum miliaceum TaxID=4540 RepID=A0A3L6SRM4_PANMI|nr:hypothetical protein C2845_PM07G08390 [Panicum miliaceum]